MLTLPLSVTVSNVPEFAVIVVPACTVAPFRVPPASVNGAVLDSQVPTCRVPVPSEMASLLVKLLSWLVTFCECVIVGVPATSMTTSSAAVGSRLTPTSSRQFAGTPQSPPARLIQLTVVSSVRASSCSKQRWRRRRLARELALARNLRLHFVDIPSPANILEAVIAPADKAGAPTRELRKQQNWQQANCSLFSWTPCCLALPLPSIALTIPS